MSSILRKRFIIIFVLKVYKYKNKLLRIREEVIESEFIKTKEKGDQEKSKTVGDIDHNKIQEMAEKTHREKEILYTQRSVVCV